MAESRGITTLPRDIFVSAMRDAGVSDTDVTSFMIRLSGSCRYFHSLFKEDLTNKATKQLCQAVIDDDHKTVARIALVRPDLLTINMPRGFVMRSQYTHQAFDLEGENVLTVVVKRRQTKMMREILLCFPNLEQIDFLKEGMLAALSQLSWYETARNAEGKKEIVIPREYSDYAQSLVDVFREETFPNGVKGALSEKTESALSLLLNILLPKSAVKLDSVIDPELFLLALYRVYINDSDLFRNYDQRDAFCIRIIGLAQSILSPETAKIFCEGIYDIVDLKRAINGRAMSMKLYTSEYESFYMKLHASECGSFYRSSRVPSAGFGFEYVCDGRGIGCVAQRAAGAVDRVVATCLDELCLEKDSEFRALHTAYADARPTFCKP